MTTTRTFAINIRWGHVNTTTIISHRNLKQHNPTDTYLFYLLPQDILTEIDFLASGLEYHNKFKAIITKINPLCNPIIFAIPQVMCWQVATVLLKSICRWVNVSTTVE